LTLHEVWVSIRSAIVTIDDPVDPLISEAGGALAEGGRWHRGTEAVTFGGSDVTGIRQVGVYKGTTPVAVRTAPAAQAGGCGQLNVGLAYTFTKPCEGARGVNGAQAVEVSTAALGDGTQTLRLVVRDTAGNEAERQLVVKVDNSAPVARELETDGAWSPADDATWTWTPSAETDRAPVAKVDVERCLGSQGCAVEEIPAGSQSYSHPVPEGESTLRVRETDAAGNVGAWSELSRVLRDRTAPAVTIAAPGVVAEGEAISPDVSATDALSGVAATEVEMRVDRGSWGGSQSAPADSVIRFRARARDRAGNVADWVESGDVGVVRRLSPETSPKEGPKVAQPPAPREIGRVVTRLRQLTARLRRGRLEVRGKVTPATATGTVAVRGGRARLRRGTFSLRVKVRTFPRRVLVTYRGDGRHAPASRRVRIRTAR
jgi:hypothetical protein